MQNLKSFAVMNKLKKAEPLTFVWGKQHRGYWEAIICVARDATRSVVVLESEMQVHLLLFV